MTGLDDRHVLYPQYAIEIGNLPQHADIFCTYWLFIFALTTLFKTRNRVLFYQLESMLSEFQIKLQKLSTRS